MTNSFTKVFLLLLVALAAAAHNPHSAGGLRAKSRPLHKSNNNNNNNNNKKHPIPNRNLENHKKFNRNIGNNHKRPTKHKPKPPSRHLQPIAPPPNEPGNSTFAPPPNEPGNSTFAPGPVEPGTFEPGTFDPFPMWDPEQCRVATDLQLDETFEGSFAGPEGTWFSVVGTGGFLAASTCTGNPALDGNALDTVIEVLSGGCDVLNYEAYDDDGGTCGNLKSTAYFETVAGETYNVYVYPLGDFAGLSFGLTVNEVTELPNTICEGAIPLGLDEIVQVETTDFSDSWFSFTGGTGKYLAVSTCTGESTSTSLEIYLDIFSGSCDNLIFETYGGGFGSCATAYIEPMANEVYHVAAYGYDYDSPGNVVFGLTVYEVTELPNTLCEGATPVELDGTVEGEISELYGMAWYSFVGTGNDLVVSTCTGNGQLDNTPFDSVIEVYARDCDDLRYIDYDDEGGKCGNGKSAVILPSVQGLTYHVAVSEYMGMTGPFGLKISTTST